MQGGSPSGDGGPPARKDQGAPGRRVGRPLGPARATPLPRHRLTQAPSVTHGEWKARGRKGPCHSQAGSPLDWARVPCLQPGEAPACGGWLCRAPVGHALASCSGRSRDSPAGHLPVAVRLIWPGPAWCVFDDSSGPTWDTQEGSVPAGTGDFGVGTAERATGRPRERRDLATCLHPVSKPMAGLALAAGDTLARGGQAARDQGPFIVRLSRTGQHGAGPTAPRQAQLRVP